MLRQRRQGSDTVQTISQARVAQATPAHSLLLLQRQAGNEAVSRSVLAVQRHYTDNVADFIAWITAHPAFTNYATLDQANAHNRCHEAARAVHAVISGAGIPVSALILFKWEDGDDAPGDHVVVVATVAGAQIVVDPTRQQFGDPACAMPEAQWQEAYLAAIDPAVGLALRSFPDAGSAVRWVNTFTNLLDWKGTAASIGAEELRPAAPAAPAAPGGGAAHHGGGHAHAPGAKCPGCTIV